MKFTGKDSNKKGIFAVAGSVLCIAAVFAAVSYFGEGTAQAPQIPEQFSQEEPKRYQNIDTDRSSLGSQQDKETEVALNNESEGVAPVTVNTNAPPKTATTSPSAENKPKTETAPAPSSTEPSKSTDSSEKEDNSSSQTESFEDMAAAENDILFNMPLQGEIVLGYSDSTAVYDPTLDQYRTNDSISIAAEVGSDVASAAEGIVESVSYNDEDGNIIVINHNNGWRSTYGQLDNITVKEGESVAAGQIIASVAEPTIYGVALGSHLDFKLTLDERTINPTLAIAQ